MIARHQTLGLVVHEDLLPSVLGEIRPAPRVGAEITLLKQEPLRSLGVVIRDRRRVLGWSQEALAARVVALGDGTFRQSDVSRLERGKVGLPHRERLRHIAAALELSLGELLARSGWTDTTAAFGPQEPPMPATTARPDGAAVLVAAPGEGPSPVPRPVVASPPAPRERHDCDRLHVALAEARATRAKTHQLLAHSQALVDPLPYPRYRVEEHVPDQAAFIIGFADTPLQYESQLACRSAQLRRGRVTADLVVIDQDTETVIRQDAVCM